MNARFACGSMVLFDLFSHNICTMCKNLCEKMGSSALPEAKYAVIESKRSV